MEEEIANIDSKMLKIGKERIEKLGAKDGGMYGYYSTRIDRGTMLNNDDEGVVNGDIVGSWELESLNLLYERVVSVPAGEDQNQEYKNYRYSLNILNLQILRDQKSYLVFYLTD